MQVESMQIRNIHPWDVDYREAVALQERLAAEVVEGPPLEQARIVAAADVSGGRVSEWIAAAVVVMNLETMEVLEVAQAAARATWPYVPGCLSFREVPVVLEAFRKILTRPDVILCDGQGRAHPRRFGLACHLGLALDVPTVGCAKSRLVGEPAGPLGRRRGSRTDLLDGGGKIGTILRTRTDVKPVYVSVGHRIDLLSAERWVLAAAPRFRLPECSRRAHQEVTVMKRLSG
jgi:deoxyribonuclease V